MACDRLPLSRKILYLLSRYKGIDDRQSSCEVRKIAASCLDSPSHPACLCPGGEILTEVRSPGLEAYKARKKAKGDGWRTVRVSQRCLPERPSTPEPEICNPPACEPEKPPTPGATNPCATNPCITASCATKAYPFATCTCSPPCQGTCCTRKTCDNVPCCQFRPCICTMTCPRSEGECYTKHQCMKVCCMHKPCDCMPTCGNRSQGDAAVSCCCQGCATGCCSRKPCSCSGNKCDCHIRSYTNADHQRVCCRSTPCMGQCCGSCCPRCKAVLKTDYEDDCGDNTPKDTVACLE